MKQATIVLMALTIVLLSQAISAQAIGAAGVNGDWKDGDEFTAKTVEGIDMKFKVLSAKDKTCQVGWQLSSQELENGVYDDYIAIDPKTTGTITIPSVVNGLQVLGVSHGAFAECEGITSVVIPEGAAFIGAMAFFRCKSLTSVQMPESLISIGYNTEYEESWYCEDDVFALCNSLTSITIPKNVSIFGRFLFEYSDNITSIYSLNENPSDAGTAFHDNPWTIGKICSNATLYVPAGTKAKYMSAGGWKNFKTIVEEGYIPEPPQTSAYLGIEPFSISAGETKDMVIDLTNPEDEITLVQFDLRLPNGLSLKLVGSEYDIDMCDRTTWRKHSLDANATDGIIRFLLASNSNTIIDGTEGAIIKITLVADANFKSGTVSIENILLVTPDEKEIKPANVEMPINNSPAANIEPVYYFTGTINGWNNNDTSYKLTNDGSRPYDNYIYTCRIPAGNGDVIEFKMTPESGLGGDWSGCLSATINGEEGRFAYNNEGGNLVIYPIANAVFYALTFNMLEQTWSYEAVYAPVSNLSIEPFAIAAGETTEMVIDLTNPEDEITLVQFDLRLPAGLSLKQVGGEYVIDMCDRTTWRKHSLDANATDGIIRFLLASSSNTVIDGHEGALIKMTLSASSSYNGGEIRLENILLVSPDEKEVKPAEVVYKPGDSSGIATHAVGKPNDAPVFSLSGQRLTAPRKGINIVDGRKVVVK